MIKSAAKVLEANILLSIEAKQSLLSLRGQLQVFELAVNEVISRYRDGGRLYIAGNGGSAADAQHLAAELVSKLAKDRAPLPAEALTVDSSVLTAIGNDYGYEKLFSRQILGKMTKKDIFLGLTTSGRSPNIIAAVNTCRAMGIPAIIFTGKDGGVMKACADFCITVPGERTSTIQELHIVLAHTLCECIENAIFEND